MSDDVARLGDNFQSPERLRERKFRAADGYGLCDFDETLRRRRGRRQLRRRKGGFDGIEMP